ncbi:MAG: nucleotide exchange factor GrpE [Oscillospiraceae bacterium]|nr:nucleotide exchange factor GrpE [Oscillospiraceae bacterium]
MNKKNKPTQKDQETPQNTIEVRDLKASLKELKEKHDKLNDQFIRLAAEYDNFRKRSIKEKEQIYLDATAYVVGQFLGVIDSLEAALKFEIPDPEFKKGFELIYNNCCSAFERLGASKIGTVGEHFDPNIHNAVLHVDDENFSESEVIEVVQKGYLVGQKVIRHAMVKVAN